VIARFLRWWLSELGALLPPGLAARPERGQWLTVELGEDEGGRAVLTGSRERVLLELAPAQRAELASRLGEVLSGLDPRRVRCRVSLPRRQVLARELELPLAAEENLREVLAFEMSRRTPFRAEDVHFDYRIESRDAAAQQLRVHLEVVPREVLAPVLGALRAWDPEPDGIPAQSASDPGADRALFAFRGAAFRERPHARLNAVLGMMVVLLAAALVWTPFAQQREHRQRLERELEAARAEAAQVAALREALAAEREARGLVAGARGGRPSMVELLEGLSRALPDGTYLFRLDVDGEQVDLHGSSDGASGLIAILEAAPELDGVRFASPVTRDGASGRERFHIVATLRPAAALAQPAGGS